jgi:hypothetical protein
MKNLTALNLNKILVFAYLVITEKLSNHTIIAAGELLFNGFQSISKSNIK